MSCIGDAGWERPRTDRVHGWALWECFEGMQHSVGYCVAIWIVTEASAMGLSNSPNMQSPPPPGMENALLCMVFQYTPDH